MMEISSKYLKNYLKKKKLEGSSIITTFFEKSNKKEKTDSNINPNASHKNIKEIRYAASSRNINERIHIFFFFFTHLLL